MNSNIKILYMGTPKLSALILEGLIQDGANIVGVVSQEDKPVGRKGIITPPPTKEVALKYHIPVFQPHKIKEDYHFIDDLDFDLILTCAYGQIVPEEVLNKPRLKSFNIHGSLLPKYRGASPMQTALINGDPVTGVTIMEMVKEMDAGGMLIKEEIPLSEEDNYSSLYDKVAQTGLALAKKAIKLIEEDNYILEEQNPNEVSFCKKLTKDDEHLNVNGTTQEFINRVRGLSDTPGAFIYLDNQVFKVFKAKMVNNKTGINGTIVEASKQGLLLQLSNGQVSLLEVQKQGKKKMDYKSFINGEKDLLGKVAS